VATVGLNFLLVGGMILPFPMGIGPEKCSFNCIKHTKPTSTPKTHGMVFVSGAKTSWGDMASICSGERPVVPWFAAQ